MDGSDLVFLEVSTGDKSPIAELTVVPTRSTWRWKRAPAPLSGKVAWLFRGARRKKAATWSFGGGAQWFGNTQRKRAVALSSGGARRKRAPAPSFGKAAQSSNIAGERGRPHRRLAKLHDRLT
ncbi:unnamed protein product [Sphagnum jensenii]|uniref:Uncharacterized protein n=1 Tax=Sphagnum jensenii TaxID=128206 RepID=A0ABP1AAK5_9BRYO